LTISRRTMLAQLGASGLASIAMSPALAGAASSQTIPLAGTEGEEPLPHHQATKGNQSMPLVRIDAFEGRSEPEIKTVLDSTHRAIVKAFHINERDRYQIYDAHPKSRFVVQDTGLGIARTDKAIIITIVSKSRPEILKRKVYKELTEELARSASIAPSDVMVCIVENSAADWTFGNGEAQFLTGELG
jgi:phenylpyruvate tautomerase PptA (4-oxalocrotonate tautomerase family)